MDGAVFGGISIIFFLICLIWKNDTFLAWRSCNLGVKEFYGTLFTLGICKNRQWVKMPVWMAGLINSCIASMGLGCKPACFSLLFVVFCDSESSEL